MNERGIPVERLLGLVPEQPEFDALRQAILRASITDPALAWSSSRVYATLNMRAVPHSTLPAMLAEAESESRKRSKRLFDAFAIALSGLTDGDVEARAMQLVSLGEAAEAADHWRDAVVFYFFARALTDDGASAELRALVLRRHGRALLQTGEFRGSAAAYGWSLTVAVAAGDTLGELTAATGLGNVATLQGRWAEAEQWYRQALARCEPSFRRERGQLLINLSMTAREQNRLDEAADRLAEAERIWSDLSSTDRSGWCNNKGLLELRRERIGEAEQCFTQALSLAVSHFDHAMILDNLADTAARAGDLDLAQQRAREAEEHAIALGSPRVLAEVYVRLGVLCRMRCDPHGAAFFEKALDLCRGQAYPLLHGTALLEFGRFRREQGDDQAARTLLQEALRVFAEIGAASHAATVREEL